MYEVEVEVKEQDEVVCSGSGYGDGGGSSGIRKATKDCQLAAPPGILTTAMLGP